MAHTSSHSEYICHPTLCLTPRDGRKYAFNKPKHTMSIQVVKLSVISKTSSNFINSKSILSKGNRPASNDFQINPSYLP